LTLANRVTLARIVLIPLVIILLLFGLDGLAFIIFMFLSFSDAVDGYIARRFGEVSDLGKVLDPLADKILVTTVLIALVGLGKASSIPVMLFVVRDLIVSGIRITAAQSNNIIAASRLAKWKTGTQIAAVAMLILSLPLANLVLWTAVILSYISGSAYLWQSKTLKLLKLS
jgi:CDP-diacylglycerol--glycerol-3-phosphate 3-phosphatidyltransferase